MALVSDNSRRFGTFVLLCLIVIATTALLYTQRSSSVTTAWAIRTAKSVAWGESKRTPYCYVQYATDSLYLCNALVNFQNLRNEGTKVDLVLLVPEQWESTGDETLKRLLAIAPTLTITLKWIKPWQATVNRDHNTWEWSLTKMHALELYDYKRVIFFDSDGVMKRPLDYLFALPEADIAMPRAYWLDPDEAHDGMRPWLSSQLMVAHPNARLTERLYNVTTSNPQAGYDMEYLNMCFFSLGFLTELNVCRLAYGSGIILNHRPTNVLSGEFRHSGTHEAYLGSKAVAWNATAEYESAHYFHFSDWPLPKPWVASQEAIDESAIERCHGVTGCDEGRLWLDLYNGFRGQRRDLCGM